MIGGKRPGFTLFEIVVVLGLFSLVAVVVIAIFINSSNSQRREAVSQKMLGDARLLIASLTQEIKTNRIDYDFYKGKDWFNGTTAADCSTFDEAGFDNCAMAYGVHVLALVSNDGQKKRYWYDGESQKLYACKNTPLLAPRNCSGTDGTGNTNFVNVTPTSVSIPALTFFIFPGSNPGIHSGDARTCVSNDNCACLQTSNPYRPQDSTPATDACPVWTSGFCNAGVCQIPNIQPFVTTSLELEGEGLQVGTVRIPLQMTTSTRTYER